MTKAAKYRHFTHTHSHTETYTHIVVIQLIRQRVACLIGIVWVVQGHYDLIYL